MFMDLIPTMGAVVSFSILGLLYPRLFTADRLFPAVVLFYVMRTPLVLIPYALVVFGNAAVSLNRVGQFLTLPERQETVEKLEEPGCEIVGGCFSWPHPTAQEEGGNNSGV